MSKFQAEFYEREDGDIPVENFLNGLDVKRRNKVLMIYIRERKMFCYFG